MNTGPNDTLNSSDRTEDSKVKCLTWCQLTWGRHTTEPWQTEGQLFYPRGQSVFKQDDTLFIFEVKVRHLCMQGAIVWFLRLTWWVQNMETFERRPHNVNAVDKPLWTQYFSISSWITQKQVFFHLKGFCQNFIFISFWYLKDQFWTLYKNFMQTFSLPSIAIMKIVVYQQIQ